MSYNKLNSEKLMKRFNKNQDNQSFKCWDCNKILGKLDFSEEDKKKCPRDIDGYYYVICENCAENDNY